MPTLNHLNIAVADPLVAETFYARWFGFTRDTVLDDFIKVRDEAGFELSLTRVPEPAVYPATFHFGFRLPTAADVQALFGRMQADAVPLRVELREAPDRVFFLALDPDGHRIEVYWES